MTQNRTPIDFADIRVGDLIERESTDSDEYAVIVRGRVTDLEMAAQGVIDMGEDRCVTRGGGSPSVNFYLLERPLEPDAAERVRIADILEEHARLGATTSGLLNPDEDKLFQKLYEKLDQHGSMVQVAYVAAWIRGGATI
jgi:hypothetical protein